MQDSLATARVQQLESTVAGLTAMLTQYQALLQRAPVLLSAFDQDGRFVLWNDECQRTLGWTMDQINADTEALSRFHAATAALDGADRTALFPAFHEHQLTTRDGSVLFLLGARFLVPGGMTVNLGFDVTAWRATATRLEHMARVDSLTGCWNRGEALRRFDELILDVRRDRLSRLTCMMMDLDHFKQINDQHGHAVGDAALRHFCDCVRDCVRETDVIGRLGGEEFLLLLPGADEAGAMALWDRLRTTLRSRPLQMSKLSLILGASAGVAMLTASDQDASDLLRRADGVLYDAKRAGRDQAMVYGVEVAVPQAITSPPCF